MKLVFVDAKLLRSILAAVSTVVDEVTMRVDPEGLSVIIKQRNYDWQVARVSVDGKIEMADR